MSPFAESLKTANRSGPASPAWQENAVTAASSYPSPSTSPKTILPISTGSFLREPLQAASIASWPPSCFANRAVIGSSKSAFRIACLANSSSTFNAFVAFTRGGDLGASGVVSVAADGTGAEAGATAGGKADRAESSVTGAVLLRQAAQEMQTREKRARFLHVAFVMVFPRRERTLPCHHFSFSGCRHRPIRNSFDQSNSIDGKRKRAQPSPRPQEKTIVQKKTTCLLARKRGSALAPGLACPTGGPWIPA
jgi:hypothetical protein